MLIAQISDCHIASPDKKTYGIAPMAENLSRCVAHINQLVPQPDITLVTGDVTNSGTEEETRNAAKLLCDLKCPYVVIPGNHDSSKLIHSVFGDKICPSIDDSSLDYVINTHIVRLIGIDSTNPGKPGGLLTPLQLGWLEAELAKTPQMPTIIFMHHPPAKCGVLESDQDGFEGAGKLATLVSRHQNIERILCGHIHLHIHTRWHGTIVTTAPGIGMQLGLDLTMTRESEFYLNSPGYLLHHWTRHKSLITHEISLESRDGPYPFKDQSL